MKTILTGSTGFLGFEITKQIDTKNIIKISRSGADMTVDLAEEIPILSGADLVIHSAGKAHVVPKTESEKKDFFKVNVTGTENLIKGLELSQILPKSFVFISSVAVYGLDSGTDVSESHELNAIEPYGLSKIQAENIVLDWCKKNNVICTILRLPLIVGQNPPGNLGAMIKAIRKGYYLNIAGGQARRSMVMVEDIAKIILRASEIGGIYNLTDGQHPSFFELSSKISQQLNKKIPYNLPKWMAYRLAKIGDILGDKSPFNSYKLSKMQSDLTFDDSKAREILGWNPNRVLDVFTIK